MGEVRVPADALYGAQTQRAVENFPISGRPLPPALLRAIGQVKSAAARANAELGVLEEDVAAAIEAAAQEVAEGEHLDQFPVDVFQTGSGTSSNMNANEVIARLAGRRLGRDVHPNDEVNASQSSNDTFPTAVHLAAAQEVVGTLLPALRHLAETLEAKAAQTADLVKAGRTHLMDATPVTLGQELGGYASQVRRGTERLEAALPRLAEVPARRHRGRDGHQHPGRVRRPGRRAAGRAHRAAGHRGPRPLRGAGRARRAGRDLGRAADGRGVAHQDLQRPAVDGVRPDRRSGRGAPARPAARVLDHARQGEPGGARGGAAGVQPGRGQRRRRRVGRGVGGVRAQRPGAGDGAQPAGVGLVAGQRLPAAGRPVRRRPRAGRRADAALRRVVAVGGHAAEPADRVRGGREDRQARRRARASRCGRRRSRSATWSGATSPRSSSTPRSTSTR